MAPRSGERSYRTKPTTKTHMDLVERIVAEVMSQLRNEPAVSDAPPANDSTNSTKTIAGRVITADTLAEQANGQTRIQIQPKALLTPSANDWIRQNKVELVRGDSNSTAPTQTVQTQTKSTATSVPSPTVSSPTASSSQILVIVQDGSSVVDAVIDDLNRTTTIARSNVTSAEAAAALVIDEIARDSTKRIVVITEKTHWVACLANRNEQTRAATVGTVMEVNGVRSVMDGNVFAMNANGRSFFELRNLIKAAVQ